LRETATIDTLFEGYHRFIVPALLSDAYATTGNFGGPGQDQIFFNRPAASNFFFEDAIKPWLYDNDNLLFYNTRIPMTLASYTTGGSKYTTQDRTRVEFSGNVNKRLQFGAGIDYVYSKGSYDNQSDKNFSWHFMGSYIGDRYEAQGYFNHHNFTTLESGGITDDRYITDPAAVQGGETSVDNKSIPTNLNAAQSHLEGSHFYLNQRYKVGFYRYRRDSITDTIVSKTYIPVTSFIWTLDYQNKFHTFYNGSTKEDTTFFPHTYLGLGGTEDTTRYWSLRNTVGISMLEGFNKLAKFGLAAYVTYELSRYTQLKDTVNNVPLADELNTLGITIPRKSTQHRLWVGAQLTKQRGKHLQYNVMGEFGLVGKCAGEIDVSGDITARAKLLGDTVSLRGYGHFKLKEAPYLLSNYLSTHYIWQNDFGKTTRFRVGGELDIPHTWTNINVGYETLKNYIYFGTDATPQQCSSPIHVLSATFTENLRFKAFHWDTRFTLQTSSNEDVLPLPKFAVYSNMYVKFTVAKVLHTQLGVDCNFYSKYYAPAYNPATMSFYNQTETKLGGFPIMSLYANFKMKQARFFVAYTHCNQTLFGSKNYFSVLHYPLNPARFQVGVSVRFVN